MTFTREKVSIILPLEFSETMVWEASGWHTQIATKGRKSWFSGENPQRTELSN